MSNSNLSKIGLEANNIVDNNCSSDFPSKKLVLKIKSLTYFHNEHSILAIFPLYNNPVADKNVLSFSNHYTYIHKDFQEKFNNRKDLQDFFTKETVTFLPDEFIEYIEAFVDCSEGSNESAIFGLIFHTNKRVIKMGKNKEDETCVKRKLKIDDEFIIGLRTTYEYKYNEKLATKVPCLSFIKIYTDSDLNRKKYYREIMTKRKRLAVCWNVCSKIIAVFTLIISFLESYYYFSQNIYKGVITIDTKALDYPSKLHTDEHGFVHIKAETEEDAFFTLGIAHARDRLWQMDFTRRLARGKLSEILGDKILRVDKMLRSVGINALAQKDAEQMISDPLQRKLVNRLNKYVEAVNFYANTNYLPPEYYLLNIKFENWTITDTFAYSRFLSFSLSIDYPLELFNNIIETHLGKEFHDLIYRVSFRNFPFSNETVISEEELANIHSGLVNNKTRVEADKKAKAKASSLKEDEIKLTKSSDGPSPLATDIGNLHASNSWAVSGSLTSTGKPILSNDPHLTNQIPSFHYIVKLYIGNVTDQRVMVGSALPGLPFFIVGSNRNISWGITTDNRDVSDICEEKLDNDDMAQARFYYTGDHKHELQTTEEIIKVKNGADVKLTIKHTQNGPLMEGFIRELSFVGVDYKYEKKNFEHSNAISLRLAHSLFDSNVKFLHEMLFATRKEDFLPYLEHYGAPLMAFIWATTEGEIGYTPIGKIPLKENKESKFCKGYLPREESKDIITGFIPRNETPVMVNPQKGFIVTANNRQMPDSYIHYSQSYAYFNRFYRIKELISEVISKKKFEVSDSLHILSDVFDYYASNMVPKLVAIIERNFEMLREDKKETLLSYLNQLKDFDYNFYKNSTAATLYATFEYNLGKHLLLLNPQNEVTKGFDNELQARGILNNYNYWNFINDLVETIYSGDVNNDAILNLENCKFFKPFSNCESYILNTFEQLDTFLLKENCLNEKGEIRQWGEVHFHYYPHSFDRVSLMRRIFSRKISTDGSRFTVKVAKNRFHDLVNGPFTSTHSANMKFISDLSDITRPYIILDTGNSGNVLSRFYDNLMEKCENNELLKIKDHEFNDDVHLLISFPEHNTLIIRNK